MKKRTLAAAALALGAVSTAPSARAEKYDDMPTDLRAYFEYGDTLKKEAMKHPTGPWVLSVEDKENLLACMRRSKPDDKLEVCVERGPSLIRSAGGKNLKAFDHT